MYWCNLSESFVSLEELASFYKRSSIKGARVLLIKGGRIIYDVPNEYSNPPSDSKDTWTLVLPGEIQDNNADTIIGNTLTWNLNHPIDNFYAESQIKSQENLSLGSYLANNVIVVLVGFIASLISIWVFLKERSKNRS